ncbi:MAG: amidase [Cytophagaceae bacterium]|nr:amidase [Gemmatimonadaceae bacterium]
MKRVPRFCALASFALVVVAVGAEAQTARRPLSDVVHEASIMQLQDGLRAGRWTSVQLVDAYLARIAAYDQQGPALNAMIRMNPAVRREAAERDRERARGTARGALHGIPIALKDNFDTFDMATSAGSLGMVGVRPAADGFVVARLRAAGAVIIGKTNMHELAAGITSVSSLGGQTRNPYDPMRCPGGSSGGTGAAIAASFAAVGWGSDTCGSIRIPSAFNNLVGLRPTQGLASRRGVVPLSHTQDIPGPLARSAEDLAIALDATVGFDAGDSVTRVVQTWGTSTRFGDSLRAYPLRGMRIGVLANYMTGDIDADIRDSVRAMVRAMQGAGVEAMDVRVADFDSIVNASVINYETKDDLIDYLRAVPGATARSAREMIDRGLYHDFMTGRMIAMDTTGTRDSEAYRRALAKQVVLRDRMVALMDSLKVDALVYPTMRRRPVLVGEPQPGGTCGLSAHSGLPALSAPIGFTNDGLPVGIEFMGRPFSDVRLVSVAWGLEQLGRRRRSPSTTPALVAGRSPIPVRVTNVVRSGAARATTRFTFDQAANILRFDVRVSGATSEDVEAVVLRRHDADGRTRVIHRMAGPGMMHASGAFPLSGIDRDALAAGRLRVALFTAKATQGDAPVTGVALR